MSPYFRSLRSLSGTAVRTVPTGGRTGGNEELGRFRYAWIDDRDWTVRYLAVERGHWWERERRLIAREDLLPLDERANEIRARSKRAEIIEEPRHDDRWDARNAESQFWRIVSFPGTMLGRGIPVAPILDTATEAETEKAFGGPRLRSSRELRGYHVEAGGADFAELDDLIVDGDWCMRFLVVASRLWWPSRFALIPPERVLGTSPDESRIYLGVSEEAVRTSPEVLPGSVITPALAEKVVEHFHATERAAAKKIAASRS